MGPSSGQEEQWTNTSAAAAADDVDNDGDWLTVMTKNGTDRLSFDSISDFLRGWNIVSNLFTKIYCKSFVNYFTCLHGCTVCHTAISMATNVDEWPGGGGTEIDYDGMEHW